MSLHLAPVSAAGRALHALPVPHPRMSADTIRPYIGILGVLIGSIASFLASRVTTFGLADLRGGLHAGFDEGAWITTAFGIGQMVAGVCSPYLGAIFGVRRVLLLGIVLVFVASLTRSPVPQPRYLPDHAVHGRHRVRNLHPAYHQLHHPQPAGQPGDLRHIASTR